MTAKKFQLFRAAPLVEQGLMNGISVTVPPGNYFVTIDFKKDGNLVFSTTQTIIVYPNLTTNTWVSSGGSLDPISGSTFQVTSALVELFRRTQFFVGKPSDGSAGNDTSGDGSAAKPYATVGKALEKISQSGSGSVDYTIRISGTVRENVTIPGSGDNAITTSKARSIRLLGQRGLNGSGSPQDELNGDTDNNGTGDGIVLTVNSAVPITIENLRITKGNATSGGGINIGSAATVKLTNGAVVAGNTATHTGERNGGGGGVYNVGKLFMYGSAVIGDAGATTAATSTTQCSNYASYGGGLFNAVGATAYLGYSAENTTAGLSGGIYYNYAKDGGEGGGIYNAGIVKMDSGNVSYNCSSGYSGGVTSEGSSANFELSGGEISHNQTDTSSNSLYGGGARISDSTFTMTGGEISWNSSNNGGGLSLIGATFTFTGGVIKDNTASVTGGGIIFESGTLNMGGSAVVAAGNDIWLDSGATITVTSSLTGYSPVATLTPESYTRTSALIAAGSGVTLANETGKFAVTSNGSNDYVLDSQGKLRLGTLVTSSTVANLSLVSGRSYCIVASSDFTNDNLATLLTSIKNSSISGASLDLSNTAITQLSSNTNWIPAKITSITLPPGLQTIASQEFQNAVDLAEIRMPNDGNSYYSVEDGILYNSTKTALLRYPPAKAGEEFTLPDTVTMLGYQAFYQNKNLVRINGLNRITSFASLQSHSFLANCQKLEEIDLSGLTCDYLPYCAFNGSKVKRVILSGSVTWFLPLSFNSCPNLTEIHFGAVSPPLVSQNDNGTAGDKNFSSCNSNLKFYVPKGSKESYLADSSRAAGFANSSYNAYATSAEALAARVFEEDPEELNMLYVKGAYFNGSSAITGSEVFIADRELIIPDLYVSDHEVTQAEYMAVMGANPSNFQGDSNPPATGEIQANRPVERISWYDAIMYCNKRSSDENLTRCYAVNGEIDQSQWGYTPHTGATISGTITCDLNADGYRLPTEAEWEYIARGGNGLTGTQYTYSGSNTVGDVAWTTETMTHEVKKKPANSLGLYDVTGNVYEWCWDYYNGINMNTPSTGNESYKRVLRGGGFGSDTDCTVSRRFQPLPDTQSGERGFRVVRSLSYSFHDYVTMLPSGTNGTAGTSGTYVTFGDWPQTIKASGVNIDTTQTITRGSFTYYKGSDGNWYVKQAENAYGEGYTYHDGTAVAQGGTSEKYFKVEPIKWRVLTTEFDHDGNDDLNYKRLLLAENILIAHQFHDVDVSDYAGSSIRSYINGDFYNTAFTSASKAMIVTTTVDNTVDSCGYEGSNQCCDNTEDKVFMLSRVEFTNATYNFNTVYEASDSKRVRKPTDFALASGVYTDQFTEENKGGKWWLRSPDMYQLYKKHVQSDGAESQHWPQQSEIGIVPALCLDN